MADKDLYNLSKIFYYFRENYFNRAYVAANDGLKRFVNDGTLKFYSAIAQLMEGYLHESMRELELLRNKGEFALGSMLTLIYAHKMHKNPDREAIVELETKVKELRKQSDDMSLFYAGHALFITRKPDKASEYIDRSIKHNKTNIFSLSLKGWIFITTDIVKESKQYFELALQVDPNYPDAGFGMAKYREMRSNFSQALEYVNRILVNKTDYLPAILENMKCMLNTTVYARLGPMRRCCSKALQGFNRLLQSMDMTEPKGAWLYYDTSRVVARVCGRNIQVLQHADVLIQRALNIDSSNPDYLIEAGYQALMSNKFNEAMKFYRSAAKTNAENMEAVYGMIHCQILDEKYDEAQQQIEFQNEVQTTNGSDLAYLKALLAKHKKTLPPEAIIKLFDEAADKHFKNLKGLPLGKKYLMCLNPDFVIEIVKEYMSNASSKPIEPGQQPDSLLRKSSGILEPLTKAVPGLLEGLFLLAKVKYLCGEIDEAKKVLKRIVDQEPSYSDAYILLAQVSIRENNLHAANEALEQGLSYNFELKSHPIYHLIRSRIMKKEGNYEEACKLLQNAMALPGVKKAVKDTKQKASLAMTPRTKAISGIEILTQDRVSVYLELAEIQMLLNRVHEAGIVIQEATSEFQGTSEESRILITNVELALKRGDVNTAIEILTQIKPDQPYYVQSREKLAEIYLKHRRDKKLYIGIYKELVERDPKPQALIILADAYMNIMEPDKAIEIYEAALRQNPKDLILLKKTCEALIKTHFYAKAVSYYEAILKSEPQSELRINLADLLSKLNQTDKAEKIIDHLLKEDVSSTNFQHAQHVTKAYEILANIREQTKQYDLVKECLIKAKDNQTRLLKRTQLEEDDMQKENRKLFCDLCYRLSVICFNQRDYESAIIYLKEAVLVDDKNLKTQMMLAEAYLYSENMEQCEQVCVYMTKTFPNDISVKIMMANFLLRKNETEKAIQQYKDLIEKNPDNFDPFVKMTKAIYRTGRLEEISDIIERTEKSSVRARNDAGFNFAKGLLCYYSYKPNDALSCFNKCRRDNTYSRQAVYAMVKIVLNPENDIIASEEDWKRLLHGPRMEEARTAQTTSFKLLQGMGDVSNDVRYRVLENCCIAHTGEKHNLEQATENLTQILNEHRDNVGAMCVISECLIGLKNVQKARQYLKRTTKLTWNIDDADELEKCWLMLAMTYMQASKLDEALGLCKKVLNVNKCSTRALEFLGTMNEQTGSHKEAAENYEKAWKYSGKNQPSIGYKLAFNYLKSKRLTDAIDIAHFILQKYPDYPKVRKEILEKARLMLR
ncbi:unnamed protein product [Didymodactylos carnosus]|uniref:Tetratricopeptide repeat protein 21B n=1 Tax=Didymodactylos carnosus TaxID=1234261 RepID=A0A814J1K0_9BILA|nr:unnamed protein product [Didymodactylos carnosus]CAF1029961.1 unnamed protein product [Didymodactylos carnosus]CAF3762430.1 unnamed protein product [Didymodactylos carnosus]CAF3800888.1 unnamed protein product [Didymodactylos carnosus]